MRTRTWPLVMAVAMALAGPAVGLAGCGSEGSDGAADAPGCRAVSGSSFTVTATNMAFADRCLTVAPGTYAVTFDNSDDGTGHDLHITGDGVDAHSRLFVGPGTDEFEVDLTRPGTYRYRCDPHDNMTGTITVTDPTATSTTAAP